MPVRNGADWLRQAVESVLHQEWRDFELIVVDDGSGDDTVALLKELARGDDRIVLLRQAPQGIVVALNRGLAAARAPLIARLDGDDRARPDRLARQLAFMQAHPDVGLLGSAAEKIDETGTVIGRITPPSEPARLATMLARTNPFIHSTVMMRAALVRELGGYRAAFRDAEDYDLWLRVAETSGIASLPEPLIQYRWHGSNLTRLNAIRQSFSVRLAQRSAACRRAGAADPARDLAEPPDWWAAEAMTSFFAEDVGLYRFLTSDRSAAPKHLGAVERRLRSLNHVERKLAQARLRAMLGETPFGARYIRIAALIALLHPGRALQLALGRSEPGIAPPP